MPMSKKDAIKQIIRDKMKMVDLSNVADREVPHPIYHILILFGFGTLICLSPDVQPLTKNVNAMSI
jgi:hypothetical protein